MTVPSCVPGSICKVGRAWAFAIGCTDCRGRQAHCHSEDRRRRAVHGGRHESFPGGVCDRVPCRVQRLCPPICCVLGDLAAGCDEGGWCCVLRHIGSRLLQVKQHASILPHQTLECLPSLSYTQFTIALEPCLHQWRPPQECRHMLRLLTRSSLGIVTESRQGGRPAVS